MNSKKSKNKELRISLGVGFFVEGLIGFAMLKILPLREAINSFFMMIIAVVFIGFLIYLISVGEQERRRKLKEHYN